MAPKTFICIDKATGRKAGTWGPSEDAPPPDNDVHAFVDEADYPELTPYDTLDLATRVVTKGTRPERPL